MRCGWRGFTRQPSKDAGLIFHSDRGSQYTSHAFRNVLHGYGIEPSMSRRGNCWDNACSEMLFGSFKVEQLHGQRFKTRRNAKDGTVAWLHRHNRTPLHSTLGYLSPMQFEENWLAAQAAQTTHDLAMGYGFQGQAQFHRTYHCPSGRQPRNSSKRFAVTLYRSAASAVLCRLAPCRLRRAL